MTLTDGTEGSADECRLCAQHAQAAQGQYIKTEIGTKANQQSDIEI